MIITNQDIKVLEIEKFNGYSVMECTFFMLRVGIGSDVHFILIVGMDSSVYFSMFRDGIGSGDEIEVRE